MLDRLKPNRSAWLWALSCLLAFPSFAANNFWQLPDSFIDDSGQTVTLANWSGTQTVVSMEFVDCRWICSTAWRKLLEIQEEADRRHIPLQFLVISLDPANDTAAGWRAYRQQRGLTRSNWHFLTGNRPTTDLVAKKLGVHWWVYDKHIMHDLRILRVDGQGQIVSVMSTYDLSASEFLNAGSATPRNPH